MRILKPNTTQVPDVIFDELLPDLTGGELKVLLYIVRRTFGFGKDADSISIKQLQNGIKTKEGKQLDRGTGLGRSTLIDALAKLRERGLIDGQQAVGDHGSEPTVYRLTLAEGVQESDIGVPVYRHGGVQPTGMGGAGVPAAQETVLQETGLQERPASSSNLVSRINEVERNEDLHVAPQRDAEPAKPSKNKLGDVIDAIRAQGIEPVVNGGRDGKAVKDCSAESTLIASTYVAVKRGTWGDDWQRSHLSIASACGWSAGYDATAEGRKGSGNGRDVYPSSRGYGGPGSSRMDSEVRIRLRAEDLAKKYPNLA